MSTFTHNTNKVISLKRVNDVNADWRNNFSKLVSTSAVKITDSSDLDVSPNVFLTVDTKTPAIRTSNSSKTFAEFISSSDTLGSLYKKVSKYGSGLGNLATLTNGVTSLISNLGGESAASTISSAIDYLGLGAAEDSEGSQTGRMWQPWMENIPMYKGSSAPTSFEYTFSFTLGEYGMWNAEEEVVKPILNLLAPALPRSLETTYIEGPYPNLVAFISNMISTLGDSGIESATEAARNAYITDGWLGAIGAVLEDVVFNSYENFLFSLSFGNFLHFDRVLIKDCKSLIFNNDTDTKGYPISGSITLEFQSLAPYALVSNSKRSRAVRFGGV